MTVDEARTVLESTTPFQRIGSSLVVRDARLLMAVAAGRRAGTVVMTAAPTVRFDDAARRVA